MNLLHLICLLFSMICVSTGYAAIWCEWDDMQLLTKLFCTSIVSGLIACYFDVDSE